MKEARRVQSALCSLALASTLVTSCGPEPGQYGGRPVALGVTSAPSTLNDVLSSGSNIERELIELLYLSLVEPSSDVSSGPQTYRPELAESWSFSADRRQLTFFLRPDARWSDGRPITAADVRFTWEAQTSPETTWSVADLKRHIVDVAVIDDWTVRFDFDEVTATQLADANEGVVLPQHVWGRLAFERWRQQPDWFAERMVTSGPYRILRWEPGEAPDLGRNDQYFDPALPRIDRVEMTVVNDEGTLLRMLETGDLHFVAQLRPRNVSQVERSSTLRVIRFPRRQYNFVAWNVRRPWFRSREVRRALAHAVDRQAIVDTILSGQGRVATSFLPSSYWAHDRSIEPWPFDPEEARRLLRQEGWIDRDGDGWLDRDGLAFRFELITNARSDVRWEALQLIRESLRQVGIDARASRLERTAMEAATVAHEFDAALTAISPDTTLNLTLLLHTSGIQGGYNFSAYSNPEVDRRIEAINRSDGVGEMTELAKQVQRIVHDDQPMLFLWEPFGLSAVSVELENVAPDARSDIGSLPHWSWRTGD